jgi:exosortase
MDHKTLTVKSPERMRLFGFLGLSAGLIWASWPTLLGMFERWSHDPRYSHGYLVPVFAAYILWHRRAVLTSGPTTSSWWGLALIGVGAGLRLVGARYFVDWFEAVSLLPSLAGIIVLVWGWRGLRWSWPAIGFLCFMIPLPYRAEYALGAPLQRFATLGSHYVLQTLGLPAVAEGNIILLGDHKIGVVDACNGLGMLYMFIAFAVAVALLVPREPLDRVLIVLSSVPIAMVANMARIVVTGFLYETAGGQVADAVYHDLAGWLMMPMALGVLWAELLLLSHLFLEREPTAPLDLLVTRPHGIAARDDPRTERS